MDSANPRIQNLDPLDDGVTGLHHRPNDCLNFGRCHQFAGDDLLGTAGKAPDLLPEHDAEGLQQPADLVLDPAAIADQKGFFRIFGAGVRSALPRG